MASFCYSDDMIIKIISPILIALGWYLYVLLDHGNNGAVRWPGMSLIAIGLLLIPTYHFVSYKEGSPKLQKPKSSLFKLSLILIFLAVVCFGIIFLYSGFQGLVWLIPASLFALAGLLMLLASLFVKGKTG